jgi:hypothetical protein
MGGYLPIRQVYEPIAIPFSGCSTRRFVFRSLTRFLTLKFPSLIESLIPYPTRNGPWPKALSRILDLVGGVYGHSGRFFATRLWIGPNRKS